MWLWWDVFWNAYFWWGCFRYKKWILCELTPSRVIWLCDFSGFMVKHTRCFYGFCGGDTARLNISEIVGGANLVNPYTRGARVC